MLNDIKLLLGITDTSKDDLLTLLIRIAQNVWKRNTYPFSKDLESIAFPSSRNDWTTQAVQQMYNSLGSETVSKYSENGLSIEYRELVNGIANSLLNEIIPNAVAIG